jgi:putative transcriptional regulator
MVVVALTELLQSKGKSRYWLEKETGISQSTISKLSNNKTSSIDFSVISKICIALDCEVSDFIKVKAD